MRKTLALPKMAFLLNHQRERLQPLNLKELRPSFCHHLVTNKDFKRRQGLRMDLTDLLALLFPRLVQLRANLPKLFHTVTYVLLYARVNNGPIGYLPAPVSTSQGVRAIKMEDSKDLTHLHAVSNEFTICMTTRA